MLTEFYKAFQEKNAEKMISFYHEEVEFSDPAFGTLKANEAKAMWKMLCQNAKDFQLEYHVLEENTENGKAKWEANYIFSKTGRKVHNKISAEFWFKDGKIIKHIDDFNLHDWAKQAMGFKGFLLGGTSFFRKKLQQSTRKLLENYMQKNKIF